MHSQLGSARQEGLEDVVAVPDPGDGESLQPSIVLLPKQSQALGLRSGGAGQADGQEGMIRWGCAKAAGCLQCYLQCMDHTWNYCCCRMVTEGKLPMSYKKAQVLLLALEKDTLAHEPRGEAQAEGFSTRH